VTERVLRRGTKTFRPLASWLEVRAGGSSRLVQRMVVDFGAEDSFEAASARMKLHHSVSLSASSVRKITLEHAHRIKDEQCADGGQGALPAQGAESIIGEIDGTMVPIVLTEQGSEGGGDARKNRTCQWKEAKLCAARVQGESTTVYSVTTADAEAGGYAWAKAVFEAGWGLNTYLHMVADGAPWIYLQFLAMFRNNGSFLIDFFHVCEYLAAARSTAGTHNRWLEVQKNRLKTGQVERVLKALRPSCEPAEIEDEHAPVRTALRYIENRMEQLDYKAAIENELPIGSGMIEGGHRHVLQKRLKISGAWWTLQNLEAMAQLRVCRANQNEDRYWESQSMAA